MSIHFPLVPATFIHIPKTGGLSFQQWVNENISNCEIERFPDTHTTLAQAKEKWAEVGITISFVRNPFARLVSMFFYNGQRAEERLHNRKNKISVTAHTSIEEDMAMLALYKKGFNRWAESQNSQTLQSEWLSSKPADITIKTEELATEFYKIQDLLGCYVPLPHINVSEHNDYREYYTPSTVKIIGELFRIDLEMFAYEF